MIKQTKPTHEELAVIKRLLDASKCINGKVLLPIRTAIDIAFENGDIREKYPERLVADLLTQPQPVIEFIKWFSRNYQMTQEINAFIRQSYPNGLCLSEYDAAISLVERSLGISKNENKDSATRDQSPCSQTYPHRQGEKLPPLDKGFLSFLDVFRGAVREKLFLTTSVANRQGFYGFAQQLFLTQRLRALTQQCVDCYHSFFTSKN